MKKQTGTQFNCFSPPVMLATLLVEFTLAVYAVWRYKLNEATRLIVALLVGLATFQLAEYFVCTGAGPQALPWSRLGFAAITTLPPLGIHLMHVLANKPNRRLVMSAYASMVAFMGYFMLASTAFTGHQCTGNYVIFQLGNQASGLYALYYYGWMFTGMTLGMHWANQLQAKGKQFVKRLQSVRAFIIGYLVFLVPVAVANTVAPETRRGIPSIMCGFAVLLALILAGYILPRVAEQKAGNRVKA